MRDKRFVAEHRGGPLSKEQHRQLIIWACECVEHVLHLYNDIRREVIDHALSVAGEWEKGNATVGEARKASVEMHALARELNNPISIAIARATGHAVATSHMSDHSLGAALYAMKAVSLSSISPDSELKWQMEKLPKEVRELVMDNMAIKLKSFRM